MPVVTTVLNNMLTTIASYFDRAYLVEDPTNAIAVGAPATTINTYRIDTLRALTWGTASGGSISTTNSAIATPLNYSVPQNDAPNKLVLTNNDGTELYQGIIALPAPLPTYTAGDGAYYVRGITLTLTEV